MLYDYIYIYYEYYGFDLIAFVRDGCLGSQNTSDCCSERSELSSAFDVDSTGAADVSACLDKILKETFVTWDSEQILHLLLWLNIFHGV